MLFFSRIQFVSIGFLISVIIVSYPVNTLSCVLFNAAAVIPVQIKKYATQTMILLIYFVLNAKKT